MLHVVAGSLNKQIANDIGSPSLRLEGGIAPPDAEEEGTFASGASAGWRTPLNVRLQQPQNS